MGNVYVTLEIGPTNDRVALVKFMVDTQSLYTFISPELADQLGVDFFATNSAQLSGGAHADIPVGLPTSESKTATEPLWCPPRTLRSRASAPQPCKPWG